MDHTQSRVGNYATYAPSPLSSRHGSQESLRHYNTMGSMSMLQTPTSTSREAATAAAVAAQKKKGLKSSLGRFFSKKEKVSGEVTDLWTIIMINYPQFPPQVKGVKDSMPDGSTSMMSMSGISMSDIDSNYDAMSLSGGRVPSKSGSVSSNIDYGRQKKK